MGMIGTLMAFEDAGFDEGDLVENDLEGASSFVRAVDVDKAWHALSVITTPADDPLGTLESPHPWDPILGGREFGEDFGYGAPRHLEPREVRAINAHLLALTDDATRLRCDPVAFTAAGVYPAIWDEDPERLWANDIRPELHALRQFYGEAAASGHHVVLVLQ